MLFVPCEPRRAMLYRKSTLAVLLALIFFSFFGTLTVSAWMFPQNYDWRYRVISNLLSPRDNPNHYWLAASGVALTGLLMLPFAGLLRRHLEVIAPRSAKLSAATFTAGIIALICACFVVPQHTHDVLGVRRLHELLGRSAAGFLAMGMLCSCWCAWKGRRRNPFAAQLFWIWSLVTLLPLVGISFSESLLLLTRLEPSWGDADPQCTATFRVLALGLLGMDGCSGSIPISLRPGFPNAAASNFAVCRSVRLRCDSDLR
jgi:hypothetical protein